MKLRRTLRREKLASKARNPKSAIPIANPLHSSSPMNWSSLPEPILLQRAFLFGLCGILLGTLSLLNTQLQLLQAPMGPINGVSLLLQFFGLGLAVMVLRKRKVKAEFKEKAQLMILILAVALLFFIFSL